MAQGIQAWTEWKEKCAIGRCGGETQEALRSFASVRFQGFLRKYVPRVGGGGAEPVTAPRDAWHLFETHAAVGGNRAGKRYKDWLFARAAGGSGDPADSIERGATVLLRDVVREHIRREWSPPWAVSLNVAAQEGESGLTLQDLLPGGVDPAADVERREFEAIARGHATAFFSAADRRERVAFLAKRLGLSLAHPAVESAADCRKSTLNETYHVFVRRVAGQIGAEYASEEPAFGRLLAAAVFDELDRLVHLWASSEKNCAQLFIEVGESPARE